MDIVAPEWDQEGNCRNWVDDPTACKGWVYLTYLPSSWAPVQSLCTAQLGKRTHARAHTRMHTHTCMCTHAHIHACTHANTHTPDLRMPRTSADKRQINP